MQIWLVRHGSTLANEENRLQGQLDYPLSEAGIKEAERLAARLANVRFSAVYSSPLQRAKDTARIILGSNNNKEPIIWPGLREYSWGVAEGHTWDEIYAVYPYLKTELQNNYWRARIPGREKRRYFLCRIISTGKKICDRYTSNQKLLLVTHGKFINAFITYMLGGDLKKRWPYKVNTASVSKLKLNCRKQFELRLFNNTDYYYISN